MSRKSTKPRRIGRPPAGAREGERVKDYPQLSIRVPADVKATLQALSRLRRQPQWRLITDLVAFYLDSRPQAERRMVHELAARSRRRDAAQRRT